MSLEAARGEVVGIEGHNGSGKSTLLRIIATVIRPTSGTARVFGCDVRTDAEAVRRHVAFMATSSGMYDDLTAVENLAFAAEMQGRTVAPSELLGVLDRVGLSQVANERLRTFSSGMQRRLALGRILLQAPRLLLLDEPYNSFDREGVTLVNEVVREIVHVNGGTALIVLHDRQSAGGLLDRLVALRAGKVESAAVAAPGSTGSEMLAAGVAL